MLKDKIIIKKKALDFNRFPEYLHKYFDGLSLDFREVKSIFIFIFFTENFVTEAFKR